MKFKNGAKLFLLTTLMTATTSLMLPSCSKEKKWFPKYKDRIELIKDNPTKSEIRVQAMLNSSKAKAGEVIYAELKMDENAMIKHPELFKDGLPVYHYGRGILEGWEIDKNNNASLMVKFFTAPSVVDANNAYFLQTLNPALIDTLIVVGTNSTVELTTLDNIIVYGKVVGTSYEAKNLKDKYSVWELIRRDLHPHADIFIEILAHRIGCDSISDVNNLFIHIKKGDVVRFDLGNYHNNSLMRYNE